METVTVQYCPCGHVDTSTNPEHVKKSKERKNLDALILPTSECEECREYQERERARYYDYGFGLEDC